MLSEALKVDFDIVLKWPEGNDSTASIKWNIVVTNVRCKHIVFTGMVQNHWYGPGNSAAVFYFFIRLL